ncbi:MAG: DUF3311 domain-containing protein [Streptosporangiaceae bacterium]
MAHSSPRPRRTGAWALITVLVLVAILGTLIVPIYARSTPALGAFPFFYWYQLIWVPVVAVLMALCYLLSTRGSRSTADGPVPPDRDGPGEAR